MHYLPFFITIITWYCLILFCVCDSHIRNCKNYKQINKENIRNCLPSIIVTKIKDQEDFVKSEVINDTKENVDLSSLLNSDMENIVQNKEYFIYNDLKLCVNLTNSTVAFSLRPQANVSSLARGMQFSMKKVKEYIPYLIVPGLIMSGVLPWVLPGINMVAMFLSMINQMAFTSSLFALVRGYIFNNERDEHIIYVNHGYKNNYHYGHR
ncbi:unnamed protein product [Brassicogethes aeneus]|uniref:Uncharacterized protein n=1 Tax=Brassicogethes aeneus TaxID=1431903 RepID=A0A9P0BAH3_BRAAE|nr:unnamed protein product [Brassicogethes aeneus]